MKPYESTPENHGDEVYNLDRANIDSIKAGLARLHQSAAREIKSEEIELHQSAALNINAHTLTTSQTVLGMAHAPEITMQNSAAGAVRAENVVINGAVGAAVANQIELGNTYAGWIAGREVRGEKIETMFLFSPKVSGEVTTLVDTRGVIIAGLIGGLFTGLLLLLGRGLFGRK